MGGAKGRDGQAGLRETGSEFRVRVHHGADRRKLAIQQRMGVKIGGRTQVAFNNLAVKIRNDHVLGAQLVVVDAGRLDDHQALLAVHARGIAEGVQNEAMADKFEVGFKDLGAEFG